MEVISDFARHANELKTNPDRIVRGKAIDALRELKEPETIHIIEVLGQALKSDPDRYVKIHAAKTLSSFKNPLVVTLLSETLPQIKDCVVLENVVKILGTLKDKRATISLSAVLDPEHLSTTVAEIITALQQINDKRMIEPLLNLSFDRRYRSDIRWKAMGVVWKKNPQKAYAPLLKLFLDENCVEDSTIIRDFFRNPLSKSALPLFIETLTSNKMILRWRAAGALGEIGDKQAVEPLLKTLGTEDTVLLKRVINSLADIKDRRAVEPLLELLDHKYADVRERAIIGLGAIGDSRAIEPLLKLLTSDDRDTRAHTAIALGSFVDARVYQPLTNTLLTDTDATVRYSAARALGKLGDMNSLPALLKAKKDAAAIEYNVEGGGQCWIITVEMGAREAITRIKKRQKR